MKTPHVALLIETSRSYGRGLLRGIIRYIREHRPWSVYFQPQGLGAAPPPWLKKWRGDGIIARIDDRDMARAVCGTGVPVVDLRLSVPELGLPVVGIDNRPVVQLAFRHFLDRGFRRFAFCGLPKRSNIWMDLRCNLFEEYVRESGHECHTFMARERRRAATWEQEEEEIADWIAGLPKPVGLMACNDDRGLEVLDACQRLGVRVPDDVAVIGVDNDEFLCNLSRPPLTSVELNTERVGYEAAALLTRLMAGKPPPAEPKLLPPRGVVARKSTDVLATADQELADAIRFIRDHACEGLRLKELLRKTKLSRRTLERRVRRLLGRSPKEEIHRVQIERAQQLLAETSLPAGVVSAKAGFSEPKYFNQVFRAKVGMTPGEYRRRAGKETIDH